MLLKVVVSFTSEVLITKFNSPATKYFSSYSQLYIFFSYANKLTHILSVHSIQDYEDLKNKEN